MKASQALRKDVKGQEFITVSIRSLFDSWYIKIEDVNRQFNFVDIPLDQWEKVRQAVDELLTMKID